MNSLTAGGFVSPIREFIRTGKPFLGICLGLQLLFESSEESPGVEGLGILKGKILRIPDAPGLKIPISVGILCNTKGISPCCSKGFLLILMFILSILTIYRQKIPVWLLLQRNMA